MGRELSQRFEDAEDNNEVSEEQIDEVINTELENGEIEAGILNESLSGDTKFCLLKQDEIKELINTN